MSTATAAALPASDAPKGKSKLLIILVAVFALLAAGGGGAAWWFHTKAAASAAAEAHGEGDEAKPAKKAEPSKPPVFLTLENFTVNLAGGDHFMQLGLVLQVADEETAEKAKTYLPQIRSKVLLLLSAKSAEDLGTPKGKQALVDEILATAREPFHAEGERVQAVLLGSMLIQ